MKNSVVTLLAGCVALTMLVTTASAEVTVFRSSGTVVDNCTFKNLTITENGDTATVSFDYSITSQNRSEINQMLVAANGKVVGVVSEGVVGSGKSGRGTVTFRVVKGSEGKCRIALGFCADYTTAQAKSQFENGHGYRLEVGYIN